VKGAKLSLFFGAVLITLAAAGAAYNILSLRHYREIAGVPGKIYDVDGYNMHLYCTGEGSPTLILDAGLGDSWQAWIPVQSGLSKITRTCSYDRAGLGFSDGRPGLRDSENISRQLHGLLQHAGITEPIILAGHSMSGMHIRKYAQNYPQDVVGLVFVDASTPHQEQIFNDPSLFRRFTEEARYRLWVWEGLIGIHRLMGNCTWVHQPGDEAYDPYLAWLNADTCTPSHLIFGGREFDAIPANGDETQGAGPYAGLPILVISRDSEGPKADPVWNGMQEDLKRLSSASHRVIAEKSGHMIMNDRPGLIVRLIGEFVQQVRDKSEPPEGLGATTRE